MNDFINSNEYKKIFNFHEKVPDRIISRESNWLEFKESFNWLCKDDYAKSMAAFSNRNGGFLVFGITNKPRNLIGLQSNNFEETDESKIAEYLNGIFSPEIQFEKFAVEINAKKVGVMRIYPAKNRPVISIKNDGKIKEAEIYYRYNARSDKIKYPELKSLLQDIRNEEKKSWMEHLEKISKIGASKAAILDTLTGHITGSTGTLVIDEKLLPKLKFIHEGTFKEKGLPTLKLIGDVKPVSIIADKQPTQRTGFRLTNDPNAPIVRIKEDVFEKFPYDYKTLTKTLRKRYINFKEDKKYHLLRKTFKETAGLTRYLDPKNPKSSRKNFYSPEIIELFDKHYSTK